MKYAPDCAAHRASTRTPVLHREIDTGMGSLLSLHRNLQPLRPFFVIGRASGNFEVVNVVKTFRGGRCVSRNVQAKTGIPGGKVTDEIDGVLINFALGIEKATGYKLKWHEFDLSGNEDQPEQIARIRAWDRVGFKAELSGGMSLN